MTTSLPPCLVPANYSACVSFNPRETHSASDENDCVCVLSIGTPFLYIIPSFPVLQVELRHARVKGYNTVGEELHKDIFIRNDPSLCRAYPIWMEIVDAIMIKVRKKLIPIVKINCLSN